MAAGTTDARKPLKLSPSMKLTKNRQFRKVYDEGEKVVCAHAVIFYCQCPTGEPGPCFGVVASKRVGKAVQRNRAKRLLREAVRSYSERMNRSDVWVVLVAKSTIMGCSSRNVTDDIGRGLEKAGLIAGLTNEN